MTGAEILLGVAAAAAIGGGVAGGIGAIQQNKAQNRQLEAEAQASEMNARIAAENAKLDARRQQRELKESRRRFNLGKGEARAQAASLGMFGGSLEDILLDMDTQAIFEQQSIIDERTSAQQGNYNQAAALKSKASGLRGSKQSGTAAAVGSILGGIGSAAGTVAGAV